MKNNLFKFSIIGFIFVSIAGSLSHFVFEWSGYNLAVAAVFPVNESIWEHLKLLFFPYLIWTVIEYYLLKKEKGLLMSKFIASIIGMASIVIFYYTYTGISGKSIEILNILSFFIGVSISFVTDNYLIKLKKFSDSKYNTLAIALFIGTGALFFIYTFVPPFIPLFKDPIHSTYGV